MHIISKKALVSFYSDHKASKSSLDAWYREVSLCKWNCFADIRSKYNSADSIGDNIVIFNIKGNNYRLEVKVAYKIQKVYIRWIGTHKEYDKRNKER